MKRSVAMKWVEALRSGKYKQTLSELKNNQTGGFCCLGVLCDISKKGKWTTIGNEVSNAYVTRTDKSDVCLPKEVQKFAGMSSGIGSIDLETIKYGEVFYTKSFGLDNLNDHTKLAQAVVKSPLTFDEIADVIQMLYKEL